MAEIPANTNTGAGTGIALESVFDVFLSYNRSDKNFVKKLSKSLLNEGLKPWLDEWNLIPGTPWQPEIEKVLQKCRSVAILIGPSGISPWQTEEMRAAINRRVQETSGIFRLIPVLLPGAQQEKIVEAYQFLSATTWVDFTGGVEDEEAIHRLACGVRGLAPGEGRQAAADVPSPSRYFLVLDATIAEADRAKVESIIELLRRYSDDASMILKKIEPGSIKLLIQGSEVGFERLLFLFKTGQLKHVLGIDVKDLRLAEEEASSGSSGSDPGAPSSSQSKSSAVKRANRSAEAW